LLPTGKHPIGRAYSDLSIIICKDRYFCSKKPEIVAHEGGFFENFVNSKTLL
jgi:hypothetical protein